MKLPLCCSLFGRCQANISQEEFLVKLESPI